ncbi:MAG: hypothetical protein WCK42_02305, partial [Myxococcaceae bacterium]
LLPRPAKFASTITRHVPIAVVIYSLTDALFTYGLICIKHTLFQLISPNPTDCSMCYFGTNAMGPHGAIGQYVFTFRDAVFRGLYSGVKALAEFWQEPIVADPNYNEEF